MKNIFFALIATLLPFFIFAQSRTVHIDSLYNIEYPIKKEFQDIG